MSIRVAIIFCLLIPELAAACSCVPSSNDLAREVREALKDASVVVQAEAVNTLVEKKDRHPYGRAEIQAVTWRVLTSWKGSYKTTDTLRTETGVQCCVCGLYVEKGERLILYLYGSEPFSVSICSIGGPGSDEKAQIKILNRLVKGKTPNQSLEPIRVGKPPLSAQLLR